MKIFNLCCPEKSNYLNYLVQFSSRVMFKMKGEVIYSCALCFGGAGEGLKYKFLRFSSSNAVFQKKMLLLRKKYDCYQGG